MKQVILRKGQAVIEDLPAPAVRPGSVLVKVSYSAVSTGTEKMLAAVSGKPLYRRVLEKPELVRRALQIATAGGASRAAGLVRDKLTRGMAVGYSASGEVVAVGAGVTDLCAGDRVACAGAGWANHAEFICVPRNLTVKVPGGAAMEEASTVTLGAIALQGVRRAAPTLGESFLVMGLGVIGQLTAQLLKAHGARVAGFDPELDRVELALSLGMDLAVGPGDNPVETARRFTGGSGVDGVIITASSPSHEIVSTAFRSCRKKARVVLVGNVGLNLNRGEMYEKELDFLVSTSYGPGRYDPVYEAKGIDYPLGYVRWTENRNMAEYIRLIGEGKVKTAPLVTGTFPIDEAPAAFAMLDDPGQKILLLLLSYGQTGAGALAPYLTRAAVRAPAGAPQTPGIALVGAGNFARLVHLPNIRRLGSLADLKAVVSPNGQQALETARSFGAEYATTTLETVCGDPSIDAILIATRHHLHTPAALQALEAGKHVLVEKPLALNRAELAKIKNFYRAGEEPKPILMTGYNRRFSPYLRRIKKLLEQREGPLLINYRVNAGYIPPDHWVHGPEGGGRNIGEACHFYDLFVFLVDAKPEKVTAQSINPPAGRLYRNDNFTAAVRFDCGSLAVLTYTALGSDSFPKERMELYFDGKVLLLDDYRSLRAFGFKEAGMRTKRQDKGHLQELEAWVRGIGEGTWPISLEEQCLAAEISFQVEELLAR